MWYERSTTYRQLNGELTRDNVRETAQQSRPESQIAKSWIAFPRSEDARHDHHSQQRVMAQS